MARDVPQDLAGSGRPATGRPFPERPASERPASERFAFERPASERPASEQPASERPASEQPDAVARLIRDDVRAMAAYHVPPSTGLLKLDAMENPFGLPPALAEELGRVLAAVPLNRYPLPAYDGLKAAIRARLGVPDGAALVLGNGSDELITLLCVATARPGAVVLSPWPSFVMYDLSARLAGSRFVGVPLAADFGLALPELLAAIEREQPAIVFLAYPNNPTGNCFDERAIEAVLRAAPGLVVVDEAYQPFAIDTWMPRLAEFPNLLVMRTVSKLGLAGVRLGYLAGAPRWVEQLEKVRPPYNINVLTEAAVCFMLDHLDVLDGQAAMLRGERERLTTALAAIPGVTVWPSRANFLLARVAGAASQAVCEHLRGQGILVKDVGRMHPLLADCLRVTVGTAEQNGRLCEALAGAAALAVRGNAR